MASRVRMHTHPAGAPPRRKQPHPRRIVPDARSLVEAMASARTWIGDDTTREAVLSQYHSGNVFVASGGKHPHVSPRCRN